MQKLLSEQPSGDYVNDIGQPVFATLGAVTWDLVTSNYLLPVFVFQVCLRMEAVPRSNREVAD